MSYVGFLWFWVFALHLSHCAILCHMSRSGTEALVRFRNRTGFPALHEAAELEKLQGLNKKRTKFGRVVAGRICRAPSSRKAERRPRPQGRQPKRRCRQSANSRCSAWATSAVTSRASWWNCRLTTQQLRSRDAFKALRSLSTSSQWPRESMASASCLAANAGRSGGRGRTIRTSTEMAIRRMLRTCRTSERAWTSLPSVAFASK